MDETVFLALADVDECGIDSWQHVLDCTEVDIANLVAPLSNDQLIDAFITEHSRDSQLLGNDKLLGHGEGMNDARRSERRLAVGR